MSSFHSADSSPNLYDEIQEMGDVSFLIYYLGYIKAASRKAKEENVEFKGMDVGENGVTMKKEVISSSELSKTYTPSEIKKIIADNLEYLQKLFPNEFNGDGLEQTYLSLDELEKGRITEKVDLSTGKKAVWRPYTIEEFDDRFQDVEPVYSVVKDTYHKRIVLVFRGTEGHLGAASSNWLANLNAVVHNEKAPLAVQEIDDENIGLHKGYYNYLFDKTADEKDEESRTKFDQIIEDIMILLKKHPGFRLHVTGHSLGGALATMCSFFLACNESIPTPVTCISFAAPRVGTRSFLNACQYLERTSQLRMLRLMNHQDTVAVIPILNYVHVGFQVRLYKDDTIPDLLYPNLKNDWKKWLQVSWDNSIIASLNLGYDHGDYRQRLDQPKTKAFLESLPNIAALYTDKDLVGFELIRLGVRFTPATKFLK